METPLKPASAKRGDSGFQDFGFTVRKVRLHLLIAFSLFFYTVD